MRSGRCYECRRQKRKCDETRPKCSLCLRAGKSCGYPEHPNFITYFPPPQLQHDCSEDDNNGDQLYGALCSKDTLRLKLRTSKTAPKGSGSFKTFTSSSLRKARIAERANANNASHLWPLESDTEKLCRTFITLVDDHSQSSFFFALNDNWLVHLPARLPHSELLATAAQCVILTFASRGSTDEKANRDALGAYITAIQHLRSVLACDGEQTKGEVVAAMKLLEIVDLTLRPRVLSWRSHGFATVDFFLAVRPQYCESDFAKSLFRSTFGMGFLKGIVMGESSPFDEQRWLDLEPVSSTDSSLSAAKGAPWRRTRVLTLLPRLIKRLREIGHKRPETQSLLAAQTVADSILDLEWDSGPSMSPLTRLANTEEADAEFLPFKFQFPEPAYRNTIAYCLHWASRIIIASLCQRLLDLGLPPPLHWPSRSDFAEQEHRCAVFICAAIPSSLSGMWPQSAAAAMLPLKTAWGAFWRLQNAHREKASEAYYLLNWLELRIDDFTGVMGTRISREDLIAYTKLVQGESSWVWD